MGGDGDRFAELGECVVGRGGDTRGGRARHGQGKC